MHGLSGDRPCIRCMDRLFWYLDFVDEFRGTPRTLSNVIRQEGFRYGTEYQLNDRLIGTPLVLGYP